MPSCWSTTPATGSSGSTASRARRLGQGLSQWSGRRIHVARRQRRRADIRNCRLILIDHDTKTIRRSLVGRVIAPTIRQRALAYPNAIRRWPTGMS